MSSVQIPNLPASIGLTGSELLEIVQAGVSVRTNTAAVAGLANAFVPVTATGGTVARTLPSHFGDILNVLDFATIAAADAAAIAAGAALHFRQAQTYNVDANLTITSPIIIEQGAIFDIADGFTLTLNGEVSAGNYQIFDTNTSGVVNGTFGTQPIRPFWWGVATNGTTKTAANDALFDLSVAAAQGAAVVLEGSGIQIVRYSAVDYSGPGSFLWSNINLSKPDTQGSVESFRIFGEEWGTPIKLTANAAVGDSTITVQTGQSITANDRYLLCDARLYGPSAGTSSASRSEYIFVQSYNSGTGVITLGGTLRSSYLVASGAAVAKMNNENTIVQFTKCQFEGADVGATQTALRILRARILQSSVSFYRFERRGMLLELCTFGGHVDLYGEDINETGLGYPLELSGCDEPLAGRVVVLRGRHPVTGSRASVNPISVVMPVAVTGVTNNNPGVVTQIAHGLTTNTRISFASVGGMTQLNSGTYLVTRINNDSYSIGVDTSAYGVYTSGGTVSALIYPRTLGGQIEEIHGLDCESSVFDCHPGFDSMTIGQVNGSLRIGTGQSCITLQGNDISIGEINVSGFDEEAMLVQFYGKPSDEPECMHSIGAANFGAGGDSTAYVASIENYDTYFASMLNIAMNSFVGSSSGGLYTTSVAAAGGINFTCGHANLNADTISSVYAYNLSAVARHVLNFGFLSSNCTSTDTNFHTLYGDGNAYAGAFGTPGVLINVDTGYLTRVLLASYLNRALDADINLGAQVVATFTNFKTVSGTGQVYRTDRTAATA